MCDYLFFPSFFVNFRRQISSHMLNFLKSKLLSSLRKKKFNVTLINFVQWLNRFDLCWTIISCFFLLFFDCQKNQRQCFFSPNLFHLHYNVDYETPCHICSQHGVIQREKSILISILRIPRVSLVKRKFIFSLKYFEYSGTSSQSKIFQHFLLSKSQVAYFRECCLIISL